MADLDKLMMLEGAGAAGEFSPTGDLLRYAGDLPEYAAKHIAEVCAATTQMCAAHADGFSRITGMNWLPLNRWAFSAGDFAVCVMGNVGVFVRAAEADFNHIYKILSEEAH